MWEKLKKPNLVHQQAFWAGKWQDAENGETIDVVNPATQEVIASIPSLGEKETLEAVNSANAIQEEWAAATNAERAVLLEKWYDLIIENSDDLARIMTLEQGKPLAEAKGEVVYGAGFVKWFAEEARRVYGDVLPSPAKDHRIMVIKQPVGVCAAITPWNFPIAMITRKVAPALAAGCTIIVKPSEMTPLSALAMVDLAIQAGIPAAAFQVVTGWPQAIGKVLTESPLVRKLSFTGSTKIGKLLMQECADTVKRLSLELGGNAPLIVFDDADIDLAIQGVMVSKFRNAGQTCVCANRIYVQSGIYNKFAEKLTETVAKLKVGNGELPGTDLGPLINNAAIEKVNAHVQDALDKGAKAILGGLHTAENAFVSPTILTNVTGDMRVAKEETFGPVAPLFKFETEAEVITQANSTEYGLGAYFFTEDPRRIWRVAEKLEFGMVGHNTGVISRETSPFGGIKLSGLGREGGNTGIDEYLECKTIHLGGIK